MPPLFLLFLGLSWPGWFSPLTNMSTSSMATALAEMDLTLGSDIGIGNWICILVAIWGNSSPLGPSSFKEQDSVELCLGLGHGHPKVVLQLLDTDVVLAFQYDTNMKSWCVASLQPKSGRASLLCYVSYSQKIGRWESTSPSGAAAPLMLEHICRVGEMVCGLSPPCPAWTKGIQSPRHPYHGQN